VRGEGSHPFWHLVTEIDLRERIRTRREQKAYLARAGKVDFFNRDVSVVELDAAVWAISKMVERDNEASREAAGG
jgi:hypothetical protein